ncbi:AAA family ATPase [Specibacter cremeus]|uniref:AAA family ATPase n=1 Tax=Specibacter cremeus TaxID=1629051 RepID=UPI001F0B720C|nr:AAA family ATPase [Specibacter cremeus]
MLDEFDYGLTLGSGAPSLLTIFTGARGIGKTVMLGEAGAVAESHGWVVISETATAGFMGRIGAQMQRHLQELGEGPARRRITGVSAAGFSITTQLPPEQQVGWRETGEALLRLLASNGTGLVVAVDEIHAADRAEISQLAAVIQHFITDSLPIGMLFAGLPAAVSDLLNEGVATFLRRADRIDLHAVAVGEVERSFAELFAQGGFEVSSALLTQAAAATDGYPFLIQLVGYFLWREAEKSSGVVDQAATTNAITAALRRNERVVLEAALSTASGRDVDFLCAMAQDEGSSIIGDVAERTGMSPSAASNYRRRLIEEGLIQPAGYGRVAFAIPGLRQHMRAAQ